MPTSNMPAMRLETQGISRHLIHRHRRKFRLLDGSVGIRTNYPLSLVTVSELAISDLRLENWRTLVVAHLCRQAKAPALGSPSTILAPLTPPNFRPLCD